MTVVRIRVPIRMRILQHVGYPHFTRTEHGSDFKKSGYSTSCKIKIQSVAEKKKQVGKCDYRSH